jgi:hypothetical protein
MAKRFVSRIKTTLSYEEVEAQLARHCRSPVEFFFEGIEDRSGEPRKVFRVEFTNEGDQLLFRVAWKTKSSD